MKKVLIYLFIALYLFTPAFAQDEIKKVKKDNFFTKIKNNISYENQRKAEEEYYNQMCMRTSDIVAKGETIENVIGGFVPNDFAIQEDFSIYQQKGNSIIGEIYKTLENIENKEYSDNIGIDMYKSTCFENKQFNIAILNKIINQYKKKIDAIKMKDYNIDLSYNTPTKIMLSNQDFDKLEEDVKNRLLLINYVFFDMASVQQTYYKFLDSSINGILNKYNQQFNENKNNLAKLNDLYNLLSSERDKLTSYANGIKRLHNQDDYCTSLMNKINNTSEKISNLQNSVGSYGISVEKTSYNNWLKKNNVKPISKTTLSNYVYGTYYEVPNKNFLYKHIPIYPVQVLQSVNGGVLLTGNYSIIQADNIQVVFLETNKKYANGYILRNPLILEYKGIYNYYNTFGAKNSIYWFRELSQAEINKKYASLPNYYFFNPNI